TSPPGSSTHAPSAGPTRSSSTSPATKTTFTFVSAAPRTRPAAARSEARLVGVEQRGSDDEGDDGRADLDGPEKAAGHAHGRHRADEPTLAPGGNPPTHESSVLAPAGSTVPTHPGSSPAFNAGMPSPCAGVSKVSTRP